MEKIGLQVTVSGEHRQITVQPGEIQHSDGRHTNLHEEHVLQLRPAGSRRYSKQHYKLRGVTDQSPGGWNGEDIRGSGGAPYQRMVPNSLAVYDLQRVVRYEQDQDYIMDWYWGTIKRKTGGRLVDGQLLSLDYEVWLCRYDAVVLLDNDRLSIVEGAVDANDSRELLLPDPPRVLEGIVLAHVFTGWGQTVLYDGRIEVAQTKGDTPVSLPSVVGRYEDMTERTYIVDVVPYSDGNAICARVGMTGDDYGIDRVLDTDSVRWSEPQPLDERKLSLPSPGTRLEIKATPHMVMNLDTSVVDPVDLVERKQFHLTASFIDLMRAGKPVRMAFYGESTARSGKWPNLLAERLRSAFPDTPLFTSNVSVGGESSIHGIERLEDEVLPIRPDLVLIEYFINNTASGQREESERTLRSIISRCQAQGATCILMTHNSMNPLFTPQGSRDESLAVHNQFKRIASDTGSTFLGSYAYFHQLHRIGRYFLTELKGNMVNHPYGNVDFTWCGFDRVVADALWKGLSELILKKEQIS